MTKNKTKVWSCGGGTQSCAIGAMIIKGIIEKPDFSVIADTGREVEYTWWYFTNVLKPALADVGVTLHRVLKSDYATVDLWSGADGDTVTVPAFSDINPLDISKLPNYCTNEWKVRVVERWLRDQGVKSSVRWIGFSMDEANRVGKIVASQGDKVWLPLIEKRMFRKDCIDIVKSMGWPKPPRSRCWNCPNQSDPEWVELTPEEREKANLLDEHIRSKDPNAFLHRSCQPLRSVDFNREHNLFSRPCDSGMCFT